MRRQGQSLEFRELAPYTLGDDIRHVDWLASARYGRPDDLLVRRFVAEEQLTVLISVDTRDTMELPQAMPKQQIALWLAEVVAWIALRSDDRVILHRLFGGRGSSIVELRGSENLRTIRFVLRRFEIDPQPAPSANLKELRPYLSPATVWLILTDFYFELDEQAVRLARQIAAAQDGWRWVILVDLNSWPHEKASLGEGVRRIEGPGLLSPESPYDITLENLQYIEEKIETHKLRFQKLIRGAGCDLVRWFWPAQEQPEPAQFFRNTFLTDKVLQRLFMREA